MNYRSNAVFAGTVFGALMGPFLVWQAWSQGKPFGLALGLGLGIGLLAGVLFGAAMRGFLRLPAVRRQIELQPEDLLPGERLLHSSLANAAVDPRAFGLTPFALGELMFIAGLKDRETIGGALHLTNLRLLFKSHRFNRLRGSFSVFLPSLQPVTHGGRLGFRKLHVSTRLARLDFVVRDADTLAARIEAARAAFGPAEEAVLQPLRARLPGVESLAPSAALDAINTLIHRGKLGQDLVQAALTPLAALGGLLASEVFDRTLAERWSRRAQR